jgi:hypothetical protein
MFFVRLREKGLLAAGGEEGIKDKLLKSDKKSNVKK